MPVVYSYNKSSRVRLGDSLLVGLLRAGKKGGAGGVQPTNMAITPTKTDGLTGQTLDLAFKSWDSN